MNIKNAIIGFWNNTRLSEKAKNKMLVETCRKVFGTDEGKIVLNMLLTDLGLFIEADNARERYLNNYAKFFIRERLGVKEEKVLTDFIAETAVYGGGK